MNTPPRSLPLSGLRAVQNARTRIFAAGGDPIFGSTTRRTSRPFRNAPDGSPTVRLFRPDMLDRLQSPLTRRPD